MDLRMSEWLINDSVLIQKMTNPSILFDRGCHIYAQGTAQFQAQVA